MEVVSTLKELLHLHPLYNEQLKMFASFGGDFTDVSRLMDMGASVTSASDKLLQAVLEELSIPKRRATPPPVLFYPLTPLPLPPTAFGLRLFPHTHV